MYYVVLLRYITETLSILFHLKLQLDITWIMNSISAFRTKYVYIYYTPKSSLEYKW